MTEVTVQCVAYGFVERWKTRKRCWSPWRGAALLFMRLHSVGFETSYLIKIKTRRIDFGELTLGLIVPALCHEWLSVTSYDWYSPLITKQPLYMVEEWCIWARFTLGWINSMAPKTRISVRCDQRFSGWFRPVRVQRWRHNKCFRMSLFIKPLAMFANASLTSCKHTCGQWKIFSDRLQSVRYPAVSRFVGRDAEMNQLRQDLCSRMKYVVEYLSGMNLMELRGPSLFLKLARIYETRVRGHPEWRRDEGETEAKYYCSRQLTTAVSAFRKNPKLFTGGEF